MRTCAVVNPVAGGGRVRQIWPRLQTRLEAVATSLSVRWTSGAGTAAVLTRAALRGGVERIVAVGGDGTLHDVVNGFFEEDAPINSSAVLAHVACGSGSDFRRTLGAPVGLDAVKQLRSDRIEPLDLLRLRYTTEDDETVHRYAINVASFGLSGTVVRNRTGQPGLLPPRLQYLTGALRALANDRPSAVELHLDGEVLCSPTARMVAVANGHSFAAGLPIAPSATPSDGLFDVIVLKDGSLLSLLGNAHQFYRGTHTDLAWVDTCRGRRLTARPLSNRKPVWLEADGELLGRLPAQFEIVPEALRVQY